MCSLAFALPLAVARTCVLPCSSQLPTSHAVASGPVHQKEERTPFEHQPEPEGLRAGAVSKMA